jgi:hypothetical protein
LSSCDTMTRRGKKARMTGKNKEVYNETLWRGDALVLIMKHAHSVPPGASQLGSRGRSTPTICSEKQQVCRESCLV